MAINKFLIAAGLAVFFILAYMVGNHIRGFGESIEDSKIKCSELEEEGYIIEVMISQDCKSGEWYGRDYIEEAGPVIRNFDDVGNGEVCCRYKIEE